MRVGSSIFLFYHRRSGMIRLAFSAAEFTFLVWTPVLALASHLHLAPCASQGALRAEHASAVSARSFEAFLIFAW